MDYDVAIIGGGPAGLTAGIYAARYGMKAVIFSELNGGVITEAFKVCNFPSYEEINGYELTEKMVNQVRKLGVRIVQAKVSGIQHNGNFLIKLGETEYNARSLIIAIGRKKRLLNIPGEKEFTGRGVSYCATCDAAFFRGKKVAVIGGGNAALTSALLLSQFADEVYIIYRRDRFFRAEKMWIDAVNRENKIKPVFNSTLKSINGDNVVKSVTLNDGSELKLDGVFVEIGFDPDTTIPDSLGVRTDNGYIVVNKKQETNVRGVFAAGDCTNNPLKQVVTACAEGAIAATSAYESLQ